MSHDKPLPPTLNYRQRRFIEAFVDPDLPSFMRAPAAMRLVSPNATPGSLRVMAHYMLHNPLVRETVQEILSRAGFGIEERADKLAALVNHPELGESVSRVTRSEGITETATRKGPTWREYLKAIEIANRSEGLYDHKRREAEAAAAEAQYRELCARFFSREAPKPPGRRGGGG